MLVLFFRYLPQNREFTLDKLCEYAIIGGEDKKEYSILYIVKKKARKEMKEEMKLERFASLVSQLTLCKHFCAEVPEKFQNTGALLAKTVISQHMTEGGVNLVLKSVGGVKSIEEIFSEKVTLDALVTALSKVLGPYIKL